MTAQSRVKTAIPSFSLEAFAVSSMAFRFDLCRTYDNLPKGGRLVISNIAAHLNGQGDLRVGRGGTYSLVLRPVRPGSFMLKDYVEWLEEAGFTRITMGSHPTSNPILVAEK